MTANRHAPAVTERELEPFVSALVGCAAVTARLIDYLAEIAPPVRYTEPLPDEVIVEGLYTELLGPLASEWSRSDVRAAATMLSEIYEALSQQVQAPLLEMERFTKDR